MVALNVEPLMLAVRTLALPLPLLFGPLLSFPLQASAPSASATQVSARDIESTSVQVKSDDRPSPFCIAQYAGESRQGPMTPETADRRFQPPG
jgi:hypothetical protein